MDPNRIQARKELAKEGTKPCVQGRMKPEELTSGKPKYWVSVLK